MRRRQIRDFLRGPRETAFFLPPPTAGAKPPLSIPTTRREPSRASSWGKRASPILREEILSSFLTSGPRTAGNASCRRCRREHPPTSDPGEVYSRGLTAPQRTSDTVQ